MAEHVYECMFILEPGAYARDSAGAARSIEQMIENNGGTILASRLWNEQKLAYPIRGRHKGAYWLAYMRMPSNTLVPFNRACQLNDLVMRHLVLKIDPRLVDTLVAVVKGEIPPPTRALADTADDEAEATEGESAEGDEVTNEAAAV